MQDVICEEVYNEYYDSAGNYHWTGTVSGEHIIRAEGADMKEIFEKIKERLEENQEITFYFDGRPPKQVIYYDVAIEIVNQVEEEYSSITLPKIAFDRMIARMESESERDIYEEESLFINVRDAARIVREIAREYSNSEIPNMSDVPDKNVGENDRWIPYSSGKMPENGRRCWVTYEWANGSLHVDKDYLVNGKWFETEDEAVKAWMYNDEETPAPYQPKGEKV